MAPIRPAEDIGNEGAPGHFPGQMECSFTVHGADYLMNMFKIALCPRKQPHDWTCCIFKHPKERAARRSLQHHNYEAVMCAAMLHKGCCDKGDNCHMAHSVFEYHMHPDKFRTKLCTEGTACKRNFCFFAHTEEQLRRVSKKTKHHQQQQAITQEHSANRVLYAPAAATRMTSLSSSSSSSSGTGIMPKVTVLAAPALSLQRCTGATPSSSSNSSRNSNSSRCPTTAAQGICHHDIMALSHATFASDSPFDLAAGYVGLSMHSGTLAAAAAATAEHTPANHQLQQLQQLQQQQLQAAAQLRLELQVAQAADATAAAAAAASMLASCPANQLCQLSPAGSLHSCKLLPMSTPYDGNSSIGAAHLPGLPGSGCSNAMIHTSPIMLWQQQQQQLLLLQQQGLETALKSVDMSPCGVLKPAGSSSTNGLLLALSNSSNGHDKIRGSRSMGEQVNPLPVPGCHVTDFCSSSSSSSSTEQLPCMPLAALYGFGPAGYPTAPSASNAFKLNSNCKGSLIARGMGVDPLPMAAVADIQLMQQLLLGSAGPGVQF